jgi:hypothetical protein
MCSEPHIPRQRRSRLTLSVRQKMKFIHYLLCFFVVFARCSEQKTKKPSKYVEVDFYGHTEVVKAASSSVLKRCCSLHNEPFSYTLIRSDTIWVIISPDPDRLKRSEIFGRTRTKAPNCIPFSPDEIKSAKPFTGELPYAGGTDEMIYEYCPTCERIMKTELKQTEPNQSLQTTTRTVTECAPSRTFRASAIRV